MIAYQIEKKIKGNVYRFSIFTLLSIIDVMKILIASDLHGDIPYTTALVELFKEGGFDKLYLLGDLLFDSIEILNPISENIIAVAGNCDSESDIDKARFLMPYVNLDYQFGKVIVLSHGHYESPYSYELPYDIFFFGHTHISTLRKDSENRIIANPGSFANPRDGVHSYLVMDEKGLKLYDYRTREALQSLEF